MSKKRNVSPGLYRPRLPGDSPWKIFDACIKDLHSVDPKADFSLAEHTQRVRSSNAIARLGTTWNLQCIGSSCNSTPTVVDRGKLLLGSLLKKYPFEDIPSSTRVDNAISDVLYAEEQTSNMNKSQRLRRSDSATELSREFIARVLGDFDEAYASLNLFNRCRHGPGSSTSTSKGNSSGYFKYSEWPYHVTADAVSHARFLIFTDKRWLGALEDSYRRRFHIPMWSILDWDIFWDTIFKIVPGNRITTVPKSGLKDRPIAIEPTLNVSLQLGVEGHIRKRLKRWGIDLDDQVKNQRLAAIGSWSDSIFKPATIDLSNASDLISLRLLKLLLPEDWYRYLCSLRSPSGLLPSGRSIRYSRYASMGNGTTFAVQSLIFSAVVYSACKRYFGRWPRAFVSVFGDDIICPEVVASDVSYMLEYYGLCVNKEKSFLRGNTKESCGSDWINGTNVRPVFLKRKPETVMDLYTYRNLLVRWFTVHTGLFPHHVDTLFQRWIPKPLWLRGPYSDNDFSSYIHSDTPTKWSNCRFEYVALTAIPTRRSGNEFLFRKLMARLSPYSIARNVWDAPTGGSVFDVTTRQSRGVRMSKRTTSDWCTTYSSWRPWSRG